VFDGATVNDISGGAAGDYGFIQQSQGSMVLAFTLQANYIPPGCGILTTLNLSGNPTGISDIVISDDYGEDLSFEYYCVDGYDCAGLCGGSSEEDECGVCDDNPDNDCTMDCAGEWGGDLIYDECGTCNGPGILPGECDCFGNVEDCVGECGGTAVADECGVCEGDVADDSYYELAYDDCSFESEFNAGPNNGSAVRFSADSC
jgi:hypothetical protein